jgi:hypothetical protein
MGSKRYIVREGFNFRIRDEKNNEKVYSEGDIVTLELEDGDSRHQLEYADERDRADALKAEQKAKKAQEAVQAAASGLDSAYLADAITAGVAQALAAVQAAQTAPAAA